MSVKRHWIHRHCSSAIILNISLHSLSVLNFIQCFWTYSLSGSSHIQSSFSIYPTVSFLLTLQDQFVPNIIGCMVFHWSMIGILSMSILLEKTDFSQQLTIPNHTMTRLGICPSPLSKLECEFTYIATYSSYEFKFVAALLCLENTIL